MMEALLWNQSERSEYNDPYGVTSIGNKAFGYYNYNDGESRKYSRFRIKCFSGTAGEKYAIDNGLNYTLLD